MVALPFNVDHAAMWRGTRESFIDLHPAGAIRSYCLATDGTLQGGFADFSNGSHPGVWNGSSQSWKDLTPMGLSGKVNGMAPGVQVGKVNFVGSERAALWRGTPESFEDFGPPGVTYSAFFATTGSIHVGQLIQNGLSRAAINFGTPGSWLGLHQFLPAQYTGYSAAKAVYQDGSTIYVGGYADFGHREAILWIGTLPCYANCDGSTRTPLLTANDFQCFLNAFASASPTANCDASSGNPALTANDFQCYINRFAAGCT